MDPMNSNSVSVRMLRVGQLRSMYLFASGINPFGVLNDDFGCDLFDWQQIKHVLSFAKAFHITLRSTKAIAEWMILETEMLDIGRRQCERCRMQLEPATYRRSVGHPS